MGTPENNETFTDSSQQTEVDYKELYEKEQKRAKEHQAAFTKSRQELSILRKEAQLLEEKLQKSIVLPAEQQQELEDLKYSDPDTWFKKKQEYEQNVVSAIQEQKTVAREEALKEAEKQTQEEYISSWLSENTDITLDMIQLDVPPRIHKAYEEGTLSIDEYLEKSKEYLTKATKKLVSPKTNDVKDLNKVPTSKNSTVDAINAQKPEGAMLEIY